ncbi:hypothetical protein SEMRO_644_G180510.1 [Seminavis robusta]|uniref:Uncharacterized protein n=1 Tax=Seminavis robusta TaxID=568900 RepID=A0A9N8E4C7_9STRA|nr:hypothetical protein SEMRO_644_G180510.1 [Seminavis robusta]|eukprot:Sro644_g180510.1 n/a (277) ;mRNA; r:38394-39487
MDHDHDGDQADDAMADPDYNPALDSENNYTDDESLGGLPAGVDPMHQHEVSALESIEEGEEEDEDEESNSDTGTQQATEANANNQPINHEDESAEEDESAYDQGIDDDNPQTEADEPNNNNSDDESQGGRSTGVDSTSRQLAKITGVAPNDMDETYGERTRQGLRQRKQREYSKHLWLAEPSDHTIMTQILSQAGTPTEQVMTQFLLEHVAHTQYSVNKGLKVFGQPGAEAVIKEMQQLHDRKVGHPVKATLLTPEERRKSLDEGRQQAVRQIHHI